MEKGRLLEDEARHFFQQVLRLRASVLFSMAAPASVKNFEDSSCLAAAASAALTAAVGPLACAQPLAATCVAVCKTQRGLFA